jgi:hypothetical protein
MRAFAIGLLFLALPADASPYDSKIDSAAYRHGIDPIVFRAVIQQETNKTPWTFNCDGEGFYFNSKQQAVMALWQINSNPWMVKILPTTGGIIRQFFPDTSHAQAFLRSYREGQKKIGMTQVNLLNDSGKAISKGEARIRTLWTFNTDIGIAQVNYRFHGVNRANVQKWFDPDFNLNYAASLIALHKRGGKSDLDAAGDYHSKTPSVRAKYLQSLMPIYKREKTNAFTPLANN